jgi:orotate phosphoribosyltransferase
MTPEDVTSRRRPSASERSEELEEVARDLVRACCVYGDFRLSSGHESDYYFDKYLFATKPSILRRLAKLMASLVPPDIDRIAAAELGAVTLGTAVSLELGVPLVIVRKDAQSYGDPRPLLGELHPGERVAIIDDVVITGSQALRVAQRLVDVGANVASLAVVLDRDEGADARFRGAGLAYSVLLRRTQFEALL